VNETFRPRSNFAWAGCAYVLIILFGANSILVGTNAFQSIFEIIFCLILGIIVYGIWIKPKMVLGVESIEVVNPLRTQSIRYTEVLELETKWALSIIHNQGRTTVWVAPASGKQRWIADKKFGWYASGVSTTESKASYGEEVSMSASLDSLSGQAAHMIRERIKRSHS
jgi:hypothetical protein